MTTERRAAPAWEEPGRWVVQNERGSSHAALAKLLQGKVERLLSSFDLGESS
ncbi:MAG: hypothetical protein HW381_1301, partial [Candidatus Rokubacteria bacterium]|nr:hypothetical protein [Candidatus Rokubacteria bacterium]